MYSHRKASLLNLYKNHPLFRGEHFIDLNQTKGSNAHELLLELVESSPKTSELGLDQKAMEKAIRAGQIEDIRNEFPNDWYQLISEIASDFHASKPFYFYFDFSLIREVKENLISSDPPFDKDEDFIQYKLMQEVERSGILKKVSESLEVDIQNLAEKFWKKYDYTVFFPAEIRLSIVAYLLSRV
jgi:hypothetical protein